MFALRRVQLKPVTSIRAARFAHQNPHGHSNDPKEIEREKQKNLKGESESSVDHAPGWNEKLASDAEIKVKATKDKRGPEQLQKDTAEKHQKEDR